jgi:exoribonuclease R
MTRARPNNAEELENLELQVRKARQLVRQSEIKVEEIEASIHEMEKFYPKIKVIHPAPPDARVDGFSLFSEVLLKSA